MDRDMQYSLILIQNRLKQSTVRICFSSLLQEVWSSKTLHCSTFTKKVISIVLYQLMISLAREIKKKKTKKRKTLLFQNVDTLKKVFQLLFLILLIKLEKKCTTTLLITHRPSTHIMVRLVLFLLYVTQVHSSHLFRGRYFQPGKMTVSSISGLLQITGLIM